MRWLVDLLKEYLLSAVLREKVSSAEKERDKAKAEAEALRQRVDKLEREIERLRSQIELDADHSDFSQETRNVLIYLFRSDGEDCDTGLMAHDLQMEQGVTNYHLDVPEKRGLARCTGGNVIDGRVFWGLTPDGRRHVVEKGLLDRTN